MQRTTFIFLLVLALGLGAWVYFYEIEGEEQRQTQADAEKQLFSLKAEELSALSVGNQHGTFSFVKRAPDAATGTAATGTAATGTAAAGGTPAPGSASVAPASAAPPDWQLTVPMSAPADVRAVEDVAYALNALRVLRTVDEAPKDLATFGLSTPAFTVRYVTASGEGTLKVGDEAPFGAGLYIQKEGDPKVYLSAYPLKDRLDKDLVGWRNKKLLTFGLPDVKRLTLSGVGYEGIELTKEGDRWLAKQAPGITMDSAAVDGMLYELQGLSALGFTGQTDSALYGLTSPILSLQLETTAGKLHSLTFGPEYGEEKRIPVVAQTGAEVLLIDAAVLPKLKKTAGELRDSRVLEVQRFGLSKLEAKVEGKSLVADRKEDSWILSGDLADKVKPADVDAILDDLVALRAESFVDAPETDLATYGLDSPAVTLTLTELGADGKSPVSQVLSLGNGGDVESPKVYARVANRSAVMKVNNFVLEDIRDILLKEKKPDQASDNTGTAPAGALELNPPDPMLKSPSDISAPSKP